MIALRLVIDTNIVASAALKPDGLQRTVLLLANSKPATLYVSQAIMDEYREVLARPKFAPTRTLQATRDPDDNRFLECADAARADYVVTANQRHFPKFWKKTKVITSRELISIVAPHLIT
jgi:predicted nucleic acid-binding protein